MEDSTAHKFEHFTAEKPETVLKIAHAGLELISQRKHNFDHHLCERIIACREFPGERGLRPNHCNYLINAMLRQTFHPEWVNFITCEFDNDTWRMNGQHTALARLEMPKTWKNQGQVNVMMYRAGTFEAMRELYSSIDRNSPRTKGNVIHSYLGGTEQFEGVAPTLVRIMGESLGFWLWETQNERTRHDGDEISHLMTHQHKALVESVLALCLDEPKLLSLDHMRRAPVIAAMYETFSKVASASIEFWHSVKTGIGFLDATDPRLKLRTALQNVKLNTNDTVARSKCINRETLYRWCINAFNHWRKGDKMITLTSTKERQRAK